MTHATIIGIDLAKNVFHLHGTHDDGTVVFRKKLSRGQVLPFLSEQPNCLVAMEACATAHDWAREIGKLGHGTRLIPPQYVKPYVKRQKNDTADAEAITEAVSRRNMRFVEVKSEEQQVSAMAYRTRQMFIGQRTQTVNALRSHLSEHGIIAPKSKAGIKKLMAMIEDDTALISEKVRDIARVYVDHIEQLTAKISDATEAMKAAAKVSETAKRLQTMPGIGVQTAMAIEAFAPDMTCFKRGRDFSAWLGLVPKQHSTGGKSRLGRVSKMGQADIRSQLIRGAMSVITAATRFGIKRGAWLERLLGRKPKLVAAVTLANRMARAVWAMLTRNEGYRNPEAA
ncbi:MAG: IS110 family transposase [Shimia sp.]|jgi:transposase|uniref:IS110 family transposase n=1 Tax=Shimia sp. TaxID=1954381 RepID=UPI001B117371|nr:IS110 family transposase [Shimia sp.]MBO6899690.1 IS110 family transposase [Shimia sp.]